MSKKTSINTLIAFASTKKGKLLSTEYLNNTKKLHWECECGNTWYTSWSSVKNKNTWCPECAIIIRDNKLRKASKDKVNIIIKDSGGCLISDYVSYDGKLLCICENGHQFTTTGRALIKGQWCSVCNQKNQKFTQTTLLETITGNGGKLIDDVDIIKYGDIIKLSCGNGHTWTTKAFNIVYNKSWCPECNTTSKGENIISQFLLKNNIEYETQHSFKDLTGITKRKTVLRFDFYLPEQNILIEYDGKQHFEPVNFFGCSDEKAIKSHRDLVMNDNIKNKYCDDNNIKLIRIPYTIKDIKSELSDKLEIL